MKLRKINALIGISLIVAGCGGGGGGGSGSGSSVAGVWRGTLLVQKDDCRSNKPPTDAFSIFTINEADPLVVVDAEQGRHYEGTLDGEGSFIATLAEQITCINTTNGNPLNGVHSNVVRKIDFATTAEDQALVVMTDTFGDCTPAIISTSCVREWVGTVDRD